MRINFEAVIRLSPSHAKDQAMKADQILAFADSMRAYARESGHDLNAANLFVHAMLARALVSEDAKTRASDQLYKDADAA